MIAPGLPNITGTFGLATIEGLAYGTGAFRGQKKDIGRAAGSGGNGAEWDFVASRASSIYGSSLTVQPPALQLIPQIKY